jgi:F-type H+-transporting ATPase subunit b
MKINWFTVIAQVINFLILVWLLKKFLYKPILDAIDEREKKIAAQIKDAEDKKAAATTLQTDLTKKTNDFDQQKKALMDKATAEANTEKDKLLEKARSDASDLQAKLANAAKENQHSQNLAIAQKTQQEVLAITKKALAEIASVSLDEQSANTFVKRLNESDDEEKKQFVDAFKSNSNAILVRSAFDMPAEQQQKINTAVETILGIKTKLQFKTTPDLISGVELTTNGYKLAWSFSGYLDSLEKNIAEKMEQPEAAEK